MFIRTTESGAALYDLGDPRGSHAGPILAALRAMPGVASVEADAWITADALPNDTSAADLWGLLGAADGSAFGIDALGAWLTTKGIGVVIAVIDIGLTVHPDLAGQSVAGYDMIANLGTANDGDGRDADAADPGDWCNAKGSTWHGTHVAGTIAALANNTLGVFGGAPAVKVQPVRVLGTCGGFASDLAAGIRWAAGGTVGGIPDNVTPARILNMSLGATTSCSAELSSAIAAARSRGAMAVVAAGNAAANASTSTPANCPGVTAVAAVGPDGKRASFSNYGTIVDVAAPGVGVLSTMNAGTTVPAGPTYVSWNGTSMATPHVALSAALLAAAYPAMTADGIEGALQVAATPFAADVTPTGCPTVRCGAGVVHVARALAAVAGPAPVLGPVSVVVTATVGGPSLAVSATTVDRDGVAAAQVRINGGTWLAMTAADGAFDEQAEVVGDRGLAPAAGTYPVCVRVTDTAAHTSDGTACASVTIAPIAPGAPTGAAATVGNGTALVSWLAPVSDGGSAITGYTVTSAPGGRTCTTAGPLTCTVTGLSNWTTYTFTVTATNAAGTGAASGPTTTVMPAPGPSTYLALSPTRLLDTRSANGLSGPFSAMTPRTFQVTGRGGVPSTATAVTGILTVTAQTAGGWVFLGPVETTSATSSTINFPVGDDRANGVTVALGAGGTLSAVFGAAPGKTVELIFDVTGYFVPSGGARAGGGVGTPPSAHREGARRACRSTAAARCWIALP